ncbi:MAG: gliding motility protein [Myxococcaceae bacterium]|nr:gliding motility protein [Myxococcaceae bacterium]
MAETWMMRLRREAREMHALVDALLAQQPTGPALRAAVEAAAQKPWFNETSYRWGPWLWRTLQQDSSQRAALRPFLLAHLSGQALTPDSNWTGAWRAAGRQLEPWLAEVDAADDVEVYRELIQWKLNDAWTTRAKEWRRLLLARLAAARSPAEKQRALQRFDFWGQLDEPTALAIFEACGPAAGKFILGHLPWNEKLWATLHATALRRHDDELAWQLYRRQVELPRWQADVRHLVTTVQDGETLVAELEKRHPSRVTDAGPVFLELAKARGHHALPYLQRHVHAVFPRWGWFGPKEGHALPELVALADRNSWTHLWTRLLQSSATAELWNAEVKRLLERDVSTGTVHDRLLLLAGAGGEWNLSGFGFAQVQPLSDAVACLMYERTPALLRGAFRLHLPLSASNRYPKLLGRLLDANDEELLDFFASRAAMDAWHPEESAGRLAAHFEALSTTDGTFARRAAHALSMMPAFAIWSYDALLEKNRLARLLFERSTPLYLADGTLVRELLESPQIHVQALAFRVLGSRDPRAGPIAARCADVLAPTLLRPLHRRTRLMAFAALEAACRADEAIARTLVSKMKDALALPDRKYPKEELVGLLGRVLARWPALRSDAERPRVYRREVA